MSSTHKEALQTRTIVTERRTIEELKLSTSTTLALGEGAKINLNKQSNNDNQSGSGTVVSLEKGPFRIINSSADRKHLKIRTPNLSLATEAAVLDLYIAPNGSEYLLLHSGTTKVCKRSDTKSSTCKILNAPCDLIRVSPGGKISDSMAWSDRTTELELTFSETFPFVLTPPRSDPIVYHSRLGVEENKCGPTSLANRNASPQQVNKTGALPEGAASESKSSLKKSDNNSTTQSKIDLPLRQIKETGDLPQSAASTNKSPIENPEKSQASPSKQSLPLGQIKETGALPQSAASTNKSPIEISKTSRKDTLEKGTASPVKATLDDRTCIQCKNDEKADKYWSKIIRQAENHIKTWWNSINQTKKYNN